MTRMKTGDKLRVTKVGPQCVLLVGEVVTVESWAVDLLSGIPAGITVRRSIGGTVEIRPGPAGAVFEPEGP